MFERGTEPSSRPVQFFEPREQFIATPKTLARQRKMHELRAKLGLMVKRTVGLSSMSPRFQGIEKQIGVLVKALENLLAEEAFEQAENLRRSAGPRLFRLI